MSTNHDAGDTRIWRRKPSKTLGAMAKLRAENEALRSQVDSLQVQWDTLKATLGMLSTTVCSHETVGS
jgi:hypothetical protein